MTTPGEVLHWQPGDIFLADDGWLFVRTNYVTRSGRYPWGYVAETAGMSEGAAAPYPVGTVVETRMVEISVRG